MMPHIVCFLRDWQLAYAHVCADLIIATSYATIGWTLLRFRAQLADLLGRHIFLIYAAFISLCGLTHVFDAVVVWTPMYWVQVCVKAATAIASVGAAHLTVRLGSTLSANKPEDADDR